MMLQPRTVRTFVLRQRGLTSKIFQILGSLGPEYLEPHQPGRLERWLQESPLHPLHLEIGFGMSTSLMDHCQRFPEERFIGVEVHTPGIAKALQAAASLGLNNLVLVHADGLAFLAERVPERALSSIALLFPDPWPKRRHWKRRLLNPTNLPLLANRLRPGGQLFFRTDHPGYGLAAEDCLRSYPSLQLCRHLPPRFEDYPKTDYHRKAEQWGHAIKTLLAERNG